jgi:hypothetical protein
LIVEITGLSVATSDPPSEVRVRIDKHHLLNKYPQKREQKTANLWLAASDGSQVLAQPRHHPIEGLKRTRIE